MAKRKAKAKTAEQMAEIENDRLAAHENVVEFVPEALAVEVLEETELDTEAAEMVEGEELPEEEPKEPISIVKDKFKRKYIENAAAVGATHKAAKRSNWDWLSQMLAAFCLNDKGKIDIGSFTDVLDANGVDHSKWTNRNKGWDAGCSLSYQYGFHQCAYKSFCNSSRI